jgi:hypothetical protein
MHCFFPYFSLPVGISSPDTMKDSTDLLKLHWRKMRKFT